MDERLAFLRAESPSSLPLPCSFTHRAPGASGEAELNYWPSRRGSIQAPHHLMLFILGNPGLLGYYPPFLNHLHSLLPPSYALLATSHIGHSTRIASPKEPLDLPQQLESKIELVKSLTKYLDGWAKENGRSHHALPKISLMGHSVGAWLSCEIMKKLNTDPQPENWPIQRGFLLFPTLGWISNTWNGWTLWPIFHRPVKPLLPLLSPLLRPLLPYISLPPTSLSLVRSPEVIKHVLHLSKSEMQLIRDPDIDWHRSQNIEDKQQGLFGVWAGGNLDGWVGKDGPLVQEALGGLGGGRVKTLEGVPHAFCLTQANSEAVAEAVASWINSIPQDTNVTPGSEPKNEPLGGTVIPM
ncbi:uncharacterized protein I303_104359 [Kwoniella dejecticola CBS 10117]|uniref:AB hydrolase-1 domain-containing protein n=1 Tax=Kwoniella dejecticola CBS 10117 TaxID=1296121 RepID=A0A1A6A5J9_9TREE|nr:uncharacterized protein I303_04665 [Kwoniella dejecticola CBS 10117]OBR85330.1 hypothetical protein I303_04665 [Kwoniella dejecticola CBS 10117]